MSHLIAASAARVCRAPLRLTAALPLAVLLAACADGATGPSRAERPSLAATNAADAVVVPFSRVVFWPCGGEGEGEDVQLDGRIKLTLSRVEDAAGGFRFRTTLQAQSISGVGLESGTAFRLVGNDTFSAIETPAGGEVFRISSSQRLISAGSTANLQAHTTVHATIGADGSVKAEVDNVTVECR